MIFDVPIVNQAQSASNWTLFNAASPAPNGVVPATVGVLGTLDRVRLTFAASEQTGATAVKYAAEPPEIVASAANGVAASPFVFAISS